MRSLFKVLLLSFAVVLAFAGCRNSPVYNVQDQVIVSPTKKSVSADEVRSAILRAGGTLGWQMRDEGKGHIVGTLNLRKHMAQVDISFSSKSYSIMYRNSDGLDYDGANIHSNYNGWVQNLQKGINGQLSAL